MAVITQLLKAVFVDAMIALHGRWERRKGNLLFHLWGEKSLGENGSRHMRGRDPRAHPFAASYTDLLGAVMNISYPARCTPEERLRLSLPTYSDGTPKPSSDAAFVGKGKLSFREWEVPTVELEPHDAVAFMNNVQGAGETREHGFTCGNDLLYWIEVSKFAIELVVRQRYVPAMRHDGKAKEPSARWMPILNDQQDSARLALLEGMMPQSALVKDATGRELLTDVIGTVSDALVRNPWAGSGCEDMASATGAESEWMDGLMCDTQSTGGKSAAHLSESVDEWLAPVRADSTRRFTTCFKLVSPSEGQGEQPEYLRAKSWRLDYLLHSTEDMSLLIDAKKLWHGSEEVRKYIDSDSSVQETFLRDLAVASRFFGPIEKSLAEPAPTHCEMGIAQASTFLRKAAVALKESGYNVMLPSWWNAKNALQVTIQLKSNGVTFFSLDSLMDFDWKMSIGSEQICEEDFKLLSSLKSEIVNIRGKWVGLDFSNVQKAMEMLNRYKAGGGISARDALSMKLSQPDDGMSFDVSSKDKAINEVFSRLTGNSSLEVLEQPPAFNGKLRDYQVLGYSWMDYLSRYGIGACLADDMGLGKTIQMIALLLKRKERRESAPTLLICPMSVVGNWAHELERFAPSLKFMVHHGTDRLSARKFIKQAQKHDLVISTYQLANKDQKAFSGMEWGIVALDEAQNIKNYYTKQSQAIRKLASQSRIALTGTPMENRLLELWSVMDFLNPGYLKNMDMFNSIYAGPIEKYRDIKKQKELQSMLKPFILRRLKTDKRIIKDLPEKREMKMYCTLTKEQASLYEAFVEQMMREIEGSGEGIKRKGLVLKALVRLKQICDHPSLYLGDGSVLEGRSGKLERLKEMLEEVVANKENSLVFTQYAQMGKLLHAYLQKALGCETFFLSGSMPRKQRDATVKAFQESKGTVFVLSLKAGGFGLNLTAANHVFHYDRWWNPAVESQATDRAYRIGQSRNVEVHKFITKGTLEEKIDAMLENKRALSDAVITGSSEAWITNLDNTQLRRLFTLESQNQS